jgi:hypothetical protein
MLTFALTRGTDEARTPRRSPIIAADTPAPPRALTSPPFAGAHTPSLPARAPEPLAAKPADVVATPTPTAPTSAPANSEHTADEEPDEITPRARRKTTRAPAPTVSAPTTREAAPPGPTDPEPVARTARPTSPSVAPPPPITPAQGALRVVTLHAGKGLWARIALDGKDTGNDTHVFTRELRPGIYVVTAERSGFVSKRRNVTIEPGKTARIRFDLEKGPPP